MRRNEEGREGEGLSARVGETCDEEPWEFAYFSCLSAVAR